jgi:hypothetical protein
LRFVGWLLLILPERHYRVVVQRVSSPGQESIVKRAKAVVVGNALLVKVGRGRGFAVEQKRGLCLYPKRFVITAAHCLPVVPHAPGFRGNWDETLPDLLGPLGRRKPKVWAECLFADPIADIAVLGEPDSQELGDEYEAYEELVGSVTPLKIGGAFAWETPRPAAMITLDGRTLTCTAEHLGDRLWLENASEPIVGGMSGSPVLDETGAAIGIVSQSSVGRDLGQHHQGMSPRAARPPARLAVDQPRRGQGARRRPPAHPRPLPGRLTGAR